MFSSIFARILFVTVLLAVCFPLIPVVAEIVFSIATLYVIYNFVKLLRKVVQKFARLLVWTSAIFQVALRLTFVAGIVYLVVSHIRFQGINMLTKIYCKSATYAVVDNDDTITIYYINDLDNVIVMPNCIKFVALNNPQFILSNFVWCNLFDYNNQSVASITKGL